MTKKRRPKKNLYPKYVVIKNDPPEWHVRRVFPTAERRNGKIVYIQFTRRCLPETAEHAAEVSRGIEEDFHKQKANQPDRTTVGGFLEFFLHSKKRSVAVSTYEFYEWIYNRHVRDKRFAKIRLSELDTLAIQSFCADPRDDRSKNELSADLINKIYRFLHTAFEQAIKWGMLEKNPAKGVLLPKSVSNEQRAFDEAEAFRFVQACRQSPDDLLFELALETGMRSQEYLILRWDDIDLDGCKVDVRRAIARRQKGGGFVIKEPKTKTSRRSIDISPELRDRIIEHQARQNRRILELRRELNRPALLRHMRRRGVNYRKRIRHREYVRQLLANHAQYDLVFPSADFTPHNRHNLNRRAFRHCLKRADLDEAGYSLKSLRHSCATLLAKHLHPKELQDRMGHSKIETTMNYYVHVQHESRTRASSKMAGILYRSATAVQSRS
jgi:integrase